jgi:transcription antitermination factor NusG
MQNIGSDTPVSSSPETIRHWYAIYTRPSHEAQVAKHFNVREIECYLPQYQVVHRWKNRCTKTLELPLFPGYIFARIASAERVRVLEVASVLFMVGTAGRPTPLPDADIEALRDGLRARNAVPHPFLIEGDRARIRHGALAGMEGVIARSKSSLRVVISLDLIMQSVAVEVDWDELEPVGALGLHAS